MRDRQKWKKLGKIFAPSNQYEWMHSHASVPIAEQIEGDIFRVYFSSRDKNNRSFTSSVIIDITNPCIILETSSTPILAPGAIGTFDDSGTMASWLETVGNLRYMYYIGWNLGVTVPFRNSIGVAVSKDGKDFSKPYTGPIIDRNINEPHFCASCCVLRINETWHMWYLSCTHWELVNGKPRHFYHIKNADSKDGINWNRPGTVAIDFGNEREYAISRPSVLYSGDLWKMWYSYRGDAYRIGYAESFDGKKWERMDAQVELAPSQDSWDSEMVEYPFVFQHDGQHFMLYNGNDYGRSGFGLAVLEN